MYSSRKGVRCDQPLCLSYLKSSGPKAFFVRRENTANHWDWAQIARVGYPWSEQKRQSLSILPKKISQEVKMSENQIVHDAEYYILYEQNGEKWEVED